MRIIVLIRRCRKRRLAITASLLNDCVAFYSLAPDHLSGTRLFSRLATVMGRNKARHRVSGFVSALISLLAVRPLSCLDGRQVQREGHEEDAAEAV